jgi:PAS domain S-box-containing protein
MVRALFCAIFMVCSLFFSHANATEPFVPTGGMDGGYIGRFAEHLEDKTKTLTVDDVRSEKYRSQFVPTNSDTPNYGLATSAHWLRFKVSNPTNKHVDWILQAEHSILKNIEVYEVGRDGQVRFHAGGTEIPFARRDIAYRKNAFSIETYPGESEIYVKVWAERVGIANCTLTAWEPKAFMNKNIVETMVFGLFYGALLAMLLYNLFIYSAVKDSSYLYYVAYISSAILTYLHLNGHALQYLYPNFSDTPYLQYLAGMGASIFACLAFAFATVFARSFLGTKKKLLVLDKVLRGFFLFYVLLALTLMFGMSKTSGMAFYAGFLIFSILMFFAGIRGLMKGIREARFFLTAWTVYLIGVLLISLKDMGVLSYSLLTQYSIQGGTLADVILLSFALGDRINIMRNEKEKAQNEVITEKQRALAVAEEARETLEKKVIERTASLAESETRFRRLSDSTFEGIVIHDRGIALDVNKIFLKMTGYSREEIIGQNVIELMIPAEYREIAKEKVAQNAEDVYEHPGRRKDGTIIPLEVRGTSIEFNGKPARVTAVRDISERKKSEAALIAAKETAESATKLKDKFVGIVAHDLRSPFFGITMLLKSVTSDKKKALDAAHQRVLEMVLNTCDQMVGSLNSLLDLNRLQTGRIIPMKKRLSCRSLAEQKMNSLKPVADGKGITLKNDLSTDIKVFADPVLFGECLSNLLSNAIKFCKIGDEISVFAPDGRPTTLAVRDSGVGMPEKMTKDLFNPSVKTFGVGTAGERGTGLGLSYCNDIMVAHGGSISVESEEGVGSVFYLALPDIKPLVLVVDDEFLVRLMAKEFLAELDVEIIEAEDGVQALEILKTRLPLVIVLDVNMPRMNGIDFLTAFKGTSNNNSALIIATTGDDAMKVKGMDVRSYMLQHGCHDFANKPFSKSDLAPRVRRLIET